jgi:hypothetical protein
VDTNPVYTPVGDAPRSVTRDHSWVGQASGQSTHTVPFATSSSTATTNCRASSNLVPPRARRQQPYQATGTDMPRGNKGKGAAVVLTRPVLCLCCSALDPCTTRRRGWHAMQDGSFRSLPDIWCSLVLCHCPASLAHHQSSGRFWPRALKKKTLLLHRRGGLYTGPPPATRSLPPLRRC